MQFKLFYRLLIKGIITADSVEECLNRSDATCKTFIDLKGASDRADKEVLLDELVVEVSGKLLKWSVEYLSNRMAKFWFQESYSEKKIMDGVRDTTRKCS